MVAEGPTGNEGEQNCARRLKEFMSELDPLLGSNPRIIDPIFALLKTYFPLKGCNIEEAIRISRQSKYFKHVGEQPRVYTILFSSAGPSGHSGFQVQFGISKETGDSSLPFAMVNK